tara:strand:- start:646 stop:816 length:171 start_codon:yes stop_codon:yes gene_type:complete
MRQSSIAIIIYIIGVVIGALFLDIWGTETSVKKGLIALGWTSLLIITLFYADKNEQ